jgi:predicted ATPase/class 3 adenylate cyclase
MNCGKPLNITCSNCSFVNSPQAKFCINCGNRLSAEITTEGDPIQRHIPKAFAEKLELARKAQTMQGERRIVTILFCDVKGSTALAEQLDPEEWAEIMNQAFEYLISPIYKYEGTLARLMGDAVLAFFGAPIAHEDDAQRAILAGLDILNGVQPFREKIQKRYQLDFNLRVGINTGLVVVGGVGSDLFMEYTALGDAINIASRMEQTALPGTLQIAEATYKKVAHLFEFETVEGVEIKGKDKPVQVYRVLGLKDKPETRTGLQGVESALVGRVGEFEQLKHVLDDLEKGRGHIINLIGEAGIGKTRLLKEICEVWESTEQGCKPFGMLPTRWNQVTGVSYEASRPYGLVQKLLRNFLGLTTSTPPEQVREILREVFSSEDSEFSVDLKLFEIVLGVHQQADGEGLEGEYLQKAIYREMLSTLDHLVQQGPTVLAIDELHWADPASVEFIIHLFQLADRLPILFICSFRPDRASPAWQVKQAAETDYAHRYVEITLRPMSEDHSNLLLDNLLSKSDPMGDLRQMILQKSDGNPLYIEEIIRTLIENEVLEPVPGNGKWRAKSSIQHISIPDNLQSLLVARIDRLEESAKHVLQSASVIGRSFHRKVLAFITNGSYELDQELNNLQRLGLIAETTRDPDIKYSFRQALTQEIAYNTILIKNRREFHKRVGEALLALFPDSIEEFASVLGHHFYQARDARALKYFKMEGDAAFHLYANQEASEYYQRAIEVAGWMDTPDLPALVELYECLGRSYELNATYLKALAVYRKLERVGSDFNSKAIRLTALIAQALVYSVPSKEYNFNKGLELLEKATALAEQGNDRAALAKIYWIQTNLYRFHHTSEKSQKFGEKAIALARELGLEEQLAYSLNDTAHTYYMDGNISRAKEVAVEAVERWRALGNQPMLADGLAGLTSISIFAGDYDLAYRYSDEGYAISQKIDNVWGQAYSRYSIGLVDLARGDMTMAIHHLRHAGEDALHVGFIAGLTLTSAYLSVVYTELGHYQLANETLERALEDHHDTLTMAKSFVLGPKLLSRAKLGRISEAEALIETEKAAIDKLSFSASYFFQLGRCYLHFAKGEYQTTIRTAGKFLTTLQDVGVEFLTPELLVLIARAQIASNLWEEAEKNLLEAHRWADEREARHHLWQISYYLGECALHGGKQTEAADRYKQAGENLRYVIERIPTDDLSESFKSRQEVSAVLGVQLAEIAKE